VGDAEFAVYVSEEFQRGKARVQDNCCTVAVVIELCKNGAQYSRFPGADFAGKFNKTGMAVNTVKEVGKCLFMVFAQIEEARVWCNIEWLFPKTEIVAVHETPAILQRHLRVLPVAQQLYPLLTC